MVINLLLSLQVILLSGYTTIQLSILPVNSLSQHVDRMFGEMNNVTTYKHIQIFNLFKMAE